MILSEKYTVSSYDTDLNGNMSGTAILKYLQEIPNIQHHLYGPTMQELREGNKVFVLSRVSVDCFLPIKDFDKITVDGWFNSKRGFAFQRYGRIFLGDKLAVQMSALWAMIDIETRKLLPADEITVGFDPDTETCDMKVGRPAIPRGKELSLVGERKVVYSDADMNMHMNNAHYPDMFCDYIPELVGRRLAGFSISYANEARLNEKFDVLRYAEGNDFYFRTVLSDGKVGAEAKFTLAEK